MPRVSKVSLCKLLLIHVVIVVIILLNVLQIDQRTLRGLLESALMVNINIGVIIIDDHNSTIFIILIYLISHFLNLIVGASLSSHVGRHLLHVRVLLVLGLLHRNLI